MTAAEILARKEKLKRRAPQIQTQIHLDRVMEGFPPDQRAAILAEVAPLLPFTPKEN